MQLSGSVGDRLVITSHHLGGKDRVGIIREVHGEGGTSPFVVEWLDEEGLHTVWPGPDAHVEGHDAYVEAHVPADGDAPVNPAR